MADGSTANEFVISRVVDAPREKVWAAWTDRERLMRWFGPKGAAVSTATLDLRPGGTFLYGMRMPDGKEIWGKFVYGEIDPPRQIVWTNSFSNPAGGITRHPFNANWPLQMFSSATFDPQPNGGTKLTIRWRPIDPTPVERQAFDSSHDSMQKGWTGTLDQLTEYLASAPA